MDRDGRLVARTLISGVFSYAGTLLLDRIPGGVALFRNSGVYLPGVLFGALVMAPAAPAGARLAARRTAAVLLSVLIYYGAVKLAMFLTVTARVRELLACALSGALGAFLVGAASRALLAAPVPGRRLLRASVVGAAAGLIFGINGTFRLPGFSEALMLVTGFTAWQSGVGVVLYRSFAFPAEI